MPKYVHTKHPVDGEPVATTFAAYGIFNEVRRIEGFLLSANPTDPPLRGSVVHLGRLTKDFIIHFLNVPPGSYQLYVVGDDDDVSDLSRFITVF